MVEEYVLCNSVLQYDCKKTGGGRLATRAVKRETGAETELQREKTDQESI